MKVVKTNDYFWALDEITSYIADKDPRAAIDLRILIDSQVDKLSDPNFPRRIGRVLGTYELVAHPNYIVLLQQNLEQVIAFDILHAAQRYPLNQS